MYKKILEKIRKFSKNLLHSTSDLVLFRVYLGADWVLKPIGGKFLKTGGGGVFGLNQAILAKLTSSVKSSKIPHSLMWEKVDNSFAEIPEINRVKVERAIRLLLKLGLIDLVPVEGAEFAWAPVLTEAGGERLEKLFPVYKPKRPWDKLVYLVNYDVPVGQNSSRDALRLFLKSLGCGLLQSSLWITCVDPSGALDDFLLKRGAGLPVVVSVWHRDWGLGRSLPEILAKVFNLADINRRYREFWEKVKRKEGLESEEKMKAALEYFAILRDDPQLPFELLSKDYWGGEAAKVFEQKFFG